MEMRFAYNSDQVAMFRVKTLRGFELMISPLLELMKSHIAFSLATKIRIASKNWMTAVSCGMKQKRRATESMWRAANKDSESRDSMAFGRRYSLQMNASLRSATRDLLLRRLVEVRKICSVVYICADDWRSNSKCVGKYSIASLHEGGR